MTADEILLKLQASFPGLSVSAKQLGGYPTWAVPAPHVRAVCERLRSKYSFDYLDVVTAIDWSGPVDPRGYPQAAPAVPAQAVPPAPAAGSRDIFEVIYIVSALSTGLRLCLRSEIPRTGHASVPSLYGIFMAADWQEREVYDMFGIQFEGHPNLKRILAPEDQAGHPLRKDYVHVPDRYD